MEVIEWAKELFEGKNVRILGTIEKPLFVANDIGEILGMEKIATTIKDFGADKKVTHIVLGPGGRQTTSLLTEKGLLKMLFISRKPIAEKFQDWVLHVLTEIRLRGRYDVNEDIKKEDVLEQTLEMKPVEGLPQLTTTAQTQLRDIDINLFRECNVVYLYHIVDNYYKFGCTDDITRRAGEHRRHFQKHNHVITCVSLWSCESSHIMSEIEDMIKVLARENDLLRSKFDMTEIIETHIIDEIIKRISSYVDNKLKYNDRYFKLQMKKIKVRKIKQERKRIEVDNESLRLRLKLLELSQVKTSHKAIDYVAPQVEQANTTSMFGNISDEFILESPETDSILDDLIDSLRMMPTNKTPSTNIVIPIPDVIDHARKWIRENPPDDNMAAQDYHKKYIMYNIVHIKTLREFNAIVKDAGYMQKNIQGSRRWIK